MQARDERVRHGRGQISARLLAVAALRQDVERGVDRLVSLAQEDCIGKGREWQRVGERQWAAHEHERMARVTLFGERRHSREFERGHDAGQFQLVRDGECDYGEIADRAFALVREERHSRAPERVHVVRKKGALGGVSGVRIDLAVDRLETE